MSRIYFRFSNLLEVMVLTVLDMLITASGITTPPYLQRKIWSVIVNTRGSHVISQAWRIAWRTTIKWTSLPQYLV